MGSLIKSLVSLFKGVKRPWQVRRHVVGGREGEAGRASARARRWRRPTAATGRSYRRPTPTPPSPRKQTKHQTNKTDHGHRFHQRLPRLPADRQRLPQDRPRVSLDRRRPASSSRSPPRPLTQTPPPPPDTRPTDTKPHHRSQPIKAIIPHDVPELVYNTRYFREFCLFALPSLAAAFALSRDSFLSRVGARSLPPPTPNTKKHNRTYAPINRNSPRLPSREQVQPARAARRQGVPAARRGGHGGAPPADARGRAARGARGQRPGQGPGRVILILTALLLTDPCNAFAAHDIVCLVPSTRGGGCQAEKTRALGRQADGFKSALRRANESRVCVCVSVSLSFSPFCGERSCRSALESCLSVILYTSRARKWENKCVNEGGAKNGEREKHEIRALSSTSMLTSRRIHSLRAATRARPRKRSRRRASRPHRGTRGGSPRARAPPLPCAPTPPPPICAPPAGESKRRGGRGRGGKGEKRP